MLVRKIAKIHTTPQLQMEIQFSTGEIRYVDFKKDVIPTNSAFNVLTNPEVFMTAKAHNSAVVWEEENIDIEASDLYDVSSSKDFSTKIASHYARKLD